MHSEYRLWWLGASHLFQVVMLVLQWRAWRIGSLRKEFAWIFCEAVAWASQNKHPVPQVEGMSPFVSTRGFMFHCFRNFFVCLFVFGWDGPLDMCANKEIREWTERTYVLKTMADRARLEAAC